MVRPIFLGLNKTFLFIALFFVTNIVADTPMVDGVNNGNMDNVNTPNNVPEDRPAGRLWSIVSDNLNAWKQWVSRNHMCALRPESGNSVHEKITRIVHGGSKLIEYTLLFPQYTDNPLTTNMTSVYRGNVWQRVTSKHGRTLLTLAHNYELLSLSMLEFGVEEMEVALLDYPEGCLGEMPEGDKINVTRTLLMNDFLWSEQDELWLDGDDHLCHQVIEEAPMKYGAFFYMCCMKTKDQGGIVCMDSELYDKWVALLYGLLEAVRVLFFLFGPLIMQAWFYSGDLRSSIPYVVHLDEVYKCHVTAHLLRHHVDQGGAFGRTASNVPLGKLRKIPHKVPLQKIRRRLKRQNIPDNQAVNLSVKRLHIIVDHTKLMTQKDVPVGFFSFLTREIILCRVLKHEPLKSCSAASCLLGSWAGSFLWIKLPGNKFPEVLNMFNWRRLVKIIGQFILIVVLIPFPFHIRVLAYYFSEAQEMSSREEALRSLGLRGPYIRSFWLGPAWPSGVIVLYAVYFESVVLLGIMRKYFYRAKKFDDIFQDCFTDLRKVSYTSIFRMLLAHLLLPLEKFGIILGPIIAIPYYIFVLPFALVIAIFYGIPTFYMIGRFLANFRPNTLLMACSSKGEDNPEAKALKGNTTEVGKESDSDYDSKSDTSDLSEDEEPKVKKNITLTNGAKTCDTMFFLDIISPDTREYPRLPETRIRQRILKLVRKQGKCCSKYVRHILAFLISVILIILMLDVLLMYAEAARFFLEVLVLTLMGVIVNADFALDYFMLFFWTLIYCNTCFKNVYERYAQLTAKIFSFLKNEMSTKVANVTRVPERFQTFTAFKYFTHQRRNEVNEISRQFEESDTDEDDDFDSAKYDSRDDPIAKDRLVSTKLSGKPYWIIHNLVLFVSRKDTPRIPKQLFWTICNELKAPGCPGPLRHSFLQAFKQLFYMVLFLMFVFIIIMSFDQVTNLSDSNQLLLTVISGFLPFIIRFVLMPKSPEIDLSEYSMKGKMEEMLLTYRQKWPAYDLTGSISTPEERNFQSGPPGEQNAADLVSKEITSVPLATALDASVCNTDAETKAEDRPSSVDLGEVQLEIPLLTPKYTVSSFAFWDGPVYKTELENKDSEHPISML